MIETKDFRTWLESALAGTANRPAGKVSFAVRSLNDPYIDTAPNDTSGSRILPVTFSLAPSQYQAYPTVGLYSQEFDLNFHFPLRILGDVWPYFDWLSKQIVGKMVLIGADYAVMNAGVPQMGQISPADVPMVKDSLKDIFKRDFVRENELWAVVSLPVFIGGGNLLNQNNGVMFGNQISYSATITPDSGSPITEALELVISSGSKATAVNPMQKVGDTATPYAKNAEQTTSYSSEPTFFVRADAFWGQILDWFNKGTLQGKRIKLTKKYFVAGAVWKTYSYEASNFVLNGVGGALMQTAAEAAENGKPITFTFLFSPSAT